MTILKNQVAAVLDRRAMYGEAEAYYEGDVPETFATAQLRRAFRTTGDRSRLNFCRSVVDAVSDRLEIASITGGTQAATNKINEVWQNNELDLEAQEIHRRALMFGDCYVIVWPDESGELQISYNSPKNMTLVYDPENPRKKLYAVKVWLEEPVVPATGARPRTRMNVYTADRVTKWVTDSDLITEASQWTSLGYVDNPWGEVPVFHFRTHRPFGRPEHKDGFDAQNAINKLFITHMYTIDYQGAPQRYALSSVGDNEMDDFNEGDTDRENVGSLRNGPGELWYLKGVAEVGEFKPADASNFLEPIKAIVRSMAALTGTPLHYFEKAGNVPSGNALRTAEGPLIKKVGDRQASFGQTWREVFRFILKVEGTNGDVQVFWKAIESLDELERWDLALKKINSGLSHRQALREGGYSEDQIEKIMEERREELEVQGSFYARKDGTLDRKPEVRATTTNDETQVVSGG